MNKSFTMILLAIFLMILAAIASGFFRDPYLASRPIPPSHHTKHVLRTEIDESGYNPVIDHHVSPDIIEAARR